ncbi:MAG: hypothetical protein RIQ53_3991 [Pseudomonadota bacterium]
MADLQSKRVVKTKVPPAPRWDTVLCACLCALLVWAPLPLGSNRPWAAALLALMVWAIVAIHLLLRVRDAVALPGELARRALPWLVAPLAGFTVLVGLQLAGFAGLGTLEASQTRFHLLSSLAHVGLVSAVLLCAHSDKRVKWLLFAMLGAGVLQAVLAVLMLSGRQTFWYMFYQFAYNGRASGTFPNADHLAGYMELCLSAGFGLLVSQFGGSSAADSDRELSWQRKLQHVMQFILSPKMLLRLALVVLVVALVMTHSRMGNGAFFIALLIVGAVIAIVSTKLRQVAMWLVISMVVVDVFIIGQWVGLEKVVDRLQDTVEATQLESEARADGQLDLGRGAAEGKQEESLQDRLRAPRLAAGLIDEAPVFGKGAGTFYLRFPAMKQPAMTGFWDHVHNDYIEIAVDTGLVGLGLLMTAALATLVRAVSLLRDNQPRLHRGVGAAALMALVCMGLHSLVDFNLQIPANAGALLVLMALAWAVPCGKPLVARPRGWKGYKPQDKSSVDAQPEPAVAVTGQDVMAGLPPVPSLAAGVGVGAVGAAGIVPPLGGAGALTRKVKPQPPAPGELTGEQMRGRRTVWSVLSAVAVVLWLSLSWIGTPVLLADYGTQRARQLVGSCASHVAQWDEKDWAPVQRQLEWGVSMLPDHGALAVALAQLHACRGAATWDDTATSIAEYQRAIELLRQVSVLRPMHAGTLSVMAIAMCGADRPIGEIQDVWRQALRLGPYEAGVQSNLLDVALRVWGDAPPDMKNWTLAYYDAAPVWARKRIYKQAQLLQVADALPAPEPAAGASAAGSAR